jgi:hypothetical protein
MTLKHECPDCGKVNRTRFEGTPQDCKHCGHALKCPVCAGDDEPTGWFRTDDGEVLACHGCNYREVAARSRAGI